MAQRTHLAPHLTCAELTARYKHGDNPVHTRRWHLLWLMAHPDDPKTVSEAARLSGWSVTWARELVKRYNTEGPDGFYDKRADNKGQDALLTHEQRAELRSAIMSGIAPDGGLWTGTKVAAWIAEKTGQKPPSSTTGLNYLHDLGFTLQVPRPKHVNAPDEEAVVAFKKSSFETVVGSNVVFQTEW